MSSDYRETEFDLLPGETMVLYTDGLTEARQGTGFFGEQRLAETLAGQDSSDVQRLVDVLISRVTEYTGRRLTDDLAVIAFHLTSADTPSRQEQGSLTVSTESRAIRSHLHPNP